MNEDKKKKKKGVLIAGLLAAAAAAGAYLFSKKGEDKREKLKGWMREAKHDILLRLEEMEEVGKQKYEEAVDEVLAKYTESRDIASEETEAFSRSLKDHWEAIVQEAQEGIEDAQDRLKRARQRLKKESKGSDGQQKQSDEDEVL